MRFALNVEGVTLRARMQNDDIRDRVKVTRIDEEIREYQIKWSKHVETMDSDRVPKIIMNYKSVGLRDLEHPETDCMINSEFRNEKLDPEP